MSVPQKFDWFPKQIENAYWKWAIYDSVQCKYKHVRNCGSQTVKFWWNSKFIVLLANIEQAEESNMRSLLVKRRGTNIYNHFSKA